MPVSPPRPKGPPLNALRAFEAAARLGGFSRAADELGVTPGAVTQQIKILEDWVGAALFARHAQGVKLSSLGAQVAAEFTASFDALGAAVQGLRAAAPQRRIQIATLPSIAQLWLSQRLPEIRRAFPDVTISVTALETPPNLLRDAFDLGVFYTEAPETDRLLRIEQDAIFPVCAPDVARHLHSPTDLAQVPLIRDATWVNDWDVWLAEVQGAKSDAIKGPTHSLYSMAIEEAVQGGGVLIGHRALVAAQMKAGVLQEVFGSRIFLNRHLAVHLPRPLEDDKLIEALCRILLGK